MSDSERQQRPQQERDGQAQDDSSDESDGLPDWPGGLVAAAEQQLNVSVTALQSMHARQESANVFRVVDWSNGVHIHRVNAKYRTCTCNDFVTNVDVDSKEDTMGDRNTCAHVLKAMFDPDETLSDGAVHAAELQQSSEIMRDVFDQLAHLTQAIGDLSDGLGATQSYGDASDGAASGESQTTTETTADGADGDATQSQPDAADAMDDGKDMEQRDAEDKAELLAEKFEEHDINDMQVVPNGGIVFFKTGKQTRDDWPYPGSFEGQDWMTEVQKAITSPEVTEYVHDGSPDWADKPHRWNDKKPGDWYKNGLHPTDVKDYIDELGL